MNSIEPIPVRVLSEGKTATDNALGPVTHPSHDLLVPLPGDREWDSAPAQLKRYLRTPVAVARDHDGSITIASVVTAPTDYPLDQDLPNSELTDILQGVIATERKNIASIMETMAAMGPDITVNGIIGVSHLPKTAILQLCNEKPYDGLFLARGPGNTPQPLWDSTIIRRVVSSIQCTAFVERIGHSGATSSQRESTDCDEKTPDSTGGILLAVGTGPHTVLGAEIARALAHATGQEVSALHLVESDADQQARQKGQEMLSLAEYVLQPIPDTEYRITRTDNVTNTLLAEIEQFDVAIIGAPTERSLRKRLFGTQVPERILDQGGASVIMVKKPDATMDSVYYRWKRSLDQAYAGNGE